jgi:two-component system, NarL family, nitrate/nitrite response regulator NarL
VKLVIGDDHTLLLDALAAALQGRGWDVVATASSPDGVVQAVCEHRPDVCLLDVSFPDGSGLDAAQKIVETTTSTRVVLFTASDDPETVLKAVDIGVSGFLRKDQGIDRILVMLDRVMAGETVIEGDLLRSAVRAAGNRERQLQSTPLRFLTSREREVLEHLAAGETTTEIAQSLHVATSTARTHVQSVLTKLGVHSRLQAVALLLREHG